MIPVTGGIISDVLALLLNLHLKQNGIVTCVSARWIQERVENKQQGVDDEGDYRLINCLKTQIHLKFQLNNFKYHLY